MAKQGEPGELSERGELKRGARSGGRSEARALAPGRALSLASLLHPHAELSTRAPAPLPDGLRATLGR